MALSVLTLAPPAVAQDASPINDQDRAVFDNLYKEKLNSVNRTRSTDDDREMIQEMLAFAEEVPDDTGLQCLIYIETVNLASNIGELGQLREAMDLLEARWPDQDAITPEQLMQFASRAYRGVERSERDEQGGHYIDLLREIAEQYETDRDLDQAIGVYRLANTVARTIGSDQLDPIQVKLDQLVAANEMAERIKMLELSVKKNPQNSPAARELVELLVTKQNDLVLASEYVRSTRDDELIDLVQMAAKGIDQANAAAAMRVADWYVAMAEDEAQDILALPMLQTARQWYARFFNLYTRDDALAKRVVEMDNLARLKISKLVEDHPELLATVRDGWAPLIAPPFEHGKYQTRGNPIKRDDAGGLSFNDSSLLIPYKQAKAYEIKLTLTVHKDAKGKNPALQLYLPANGRVLSTRYYLGNRSIAGMDAVDESVLISPAPGREGQKCELTFQVALDDTQCAFAMLYNGKPAVKWQGQLEQLQPIDRSWFKDLDVEIDHAMYLSCTANVTIHAVDYKPRR